MENDFILDIFGQQILPIYTQICFGFPVTDAQSYSLIIETLEAALERLHTQFPWLAGSVVNDEATENSTGVSKIRIQGEKHLLIVKDLRCGSSFPTMQTLRRKGFPIHAFDEDFIASRRTLMETDDSSSPEVFLVQATLITGGLLLTFLGHHQAMDGIGQDQIIQLFSKACRNEEFTGEERSVVNLAAGNNIPLLEALSELPPALDHQIVDKQNAPLQSTFHPVPDCTWVYFSFSEHSLQALKATAVQDSPANFISTDDALSAFIWKSVTAARLTHVPATTLSTFARAVDVRGLLSISPLHPGFVQNMTYNTFTFQELTDMPLGLLASHLRSKVDPETSTLAHDTRALATYLSRTVDKSCVSFAATMKGASDVFFSSWAKMKSYEYDFGAGLGRAEVVRRTRSNNMTEGLMYLMPKSPSGEIGLVVCLSEEDMAALRRSDQFVQFVLYVG
ncbi:hypothetical protein Q7P36_008696 [Cladosporium allicinum]